MSGRMLLTIKDEAQRRQIVQTILSMPVGTRVEIKPTKRSLPQNDLMWGLLTDVSRQVTHINGNHYPAEIWKLIFLQALGHETIFLPTLDGRSVFPLGRSSSDLTKDEAGDLITYIVAWGDQMGVRFSNLPPLVGPIR